MILFKSCYILVTKFQFSTFFDKEFLKQTDPKKTSDPPKTILRFVIRLGNLEGTN